MTLFYTIPFCPLGSEVRVSFPWMNSLDVGEFNKKFQPVRNKTNRENTRKKKQSHAQDNIYVVRQFAYVHGVARISL